MNAAARVISDTRKFDCGLMTTLHDELHWLDVPERIEYKLGVMVYRCLHGRRLGTLLTTSFQPLMPLHAVVVYDLHTRTVSWCLAVDLARTAVGLFIMLA